MYKLELSLEAQRFYSRCDRPLAKKIAQCFQSLEKNPRRGNNVKPLKGKFGQIKGGQIKGDGQIKGGQIKGDANL